ncbi:MAG: amino acid ABC transporter ATP-binding protein [Lachnospiraceae bacterium]|nr:amino acid ABC transporter ATP-binding protein [Lachnospiraceae bacterium]
MIELRNVKKKFGNNQVLKDVTLTLEEGNVTVLIGSSGSGKTTLLRCMSFLERADGGELNFCGNVISFKKATKKEILNTRKKMAFVFQNYNLFANKTAIENIMEGLVTGRNVPKETAMERAVDALKLVGLEGRENYYPSQLSGGQQQRVGIARAIVLDPDIILFDEPTSALDPELVAEILDLIKKVANQGITMLIVTHEMAFAQDIADKVVFMDGGVIVEEGKPGEMFVNPKEERTRQFLARFIPLEPTYII